MSWHHLHNSDSLPGKVLIKVGSKKNYFEFFLLNQRHVLEFYTCLKSSRIIFVVRYQEFKGFACKCSSSQDAWYHKENTFFLVIKCNQTSQDNCVACHVIPRLYGLMCPLIIMLYSLHDCFALFFVCLFCFDFGGGGRDHQKLTSFSMVWTPVARLSHHGL